MGSVKPPKSGTIDENIDYSKLTGRAEASNTQFYKSLIGIKVEEGMQQPMLD